MTNKEEIRIRILALWYWNHGAMPPMEDRPAVARYIHDHPELFKGATPQ